MENDQINEQIQAQVSDIFGKTMTQNVTHTIRQEVIMGGKSGLASVSRYPGLDVEPLFLVVKTTLEDTIQLAEMYFKPGNQKQAKWIQNHVSKSGCELKLLKKISCKVGCSESDTEAFESVIKVLSMHSWEKRALVTLAAFVMSYGELMFFVHSQEQNIFSSLTSLRQVSLLRECHSKGEVQQAFYHLNELAKTSVEILELILKFDDLPASINRGVDIKNIVVTLSRMVIQSVICCMFQVNHLTDEGIPSPNLKLDVWIRNLKGCQEYLMVQREIVVSTARFKISNCIEQQQGITELITCLIDSKQYFYDCNLRPAQVTALKGNSVLLFISTLYIYEEEWQVLENVLEGHHNYRIVWFPIVEGTIQWDITIKKRIQTISQKLNCFTIYNYESSFVGVEYIRNEWCFNRNPMVKVFESTGSIKCHDAMQMIRLWGSQAFPFEQERPKQLISINPDCFGIFYSLCEEIKKVEGSYILFYGGEEERINTFEQEVKTKVRQSWKAVNISEFAIGEKQGPNGLVAWKFWSIIETFYNHGAGCLDSKVIAEIQRLLSYKKHKTGWSVLYRKGSSLVCGPRDLIIDAVDKCLIKDRPTPGKPYDMRPDVVLPNTICCHVELKSNSEWLPMGLECPVCHVTMKRVVTYECCHEKLKT